MRGDFFTVWRFADLDRLTGFGPRGEWGGDLAWLVAWGFGELTGDAFRLTRRRLRFADLALSLGRPQPAQRNRGAGADWDAHFAWLKGQPQVPTNPVDDLRAEERR